MSGHTGEVLSVSYFDGGSDSTSRIVSGSWDKTVRVWDAVSGQCVRVVTGTSAIPADIPVATASAAQRDLSLVQASAPAGIDLSDACVHGSSAYASVNNTVHILRLLPI